MSDFQRTKRTGLESAWDKEKNYMAIHRWKTMLKDRICLLTLNTTVVVTNESIAFKKAQNKQTKSPEEANR